MMKDDKRIIDMTLEGEFVAPPPPPRLDRRTDHGLGHRDDGARHDGADRGFSILVRGDAVAAGFGARADRVLAFRYQMWRGGNSFIVRRGRW